MSVSKYTVAWQDKELENKTEVTVNASISDVNASFLQLEIPGSVVRNPKDTGSYQCILSCVTASGRASIYTSQSIVLNITGKNYSLEYVDIKGLLLFCCNNFYLLRFLLSTSFKNKKRTINPKYIYIPNVWCVIFVLSFIHMLHHATLFEFYFLLLSLRVSRFDHRYILNKPCKFWGISSKGYVASSFKKEENFSMNIFMLFLFLVYSIEILELIKIPNENVLTDRHEEVFMRETQKSDELFWKETYKHILSNIHWLHFFMFDQNIFVFRKYHKDLKHFSWLYYTNYGWNVFHIYCFVIYLFF